MELRISFMSGRRDDPDEMDSCGLFSRYFAEGEIPLPATEAGTLFSFGK
jgi:hypothetical protein